MIEHEEGETGEGQDDKILGWVVKIPFEEYIKGIMLNLKSNNSAGLNSRQLESGHNLLHMHERR